MDDVQAVVLLILFVTGVFTAIAWNFLAATAPKESGNSKMADAIRLMLKDQPLHGYELSKRLKKHDPTLFSRGEALLYPVLHIMEDSGELISETKVEEGRTRRYYRLSR